MSGHLIQFDRVLKHTRKPYLDKAPALPFVKWAGGKRSLIPDLAQHFPERIGSYWEPFVGGGAVFFTFANRIDRAHLSDTNEELVIAYQMVRNQVEGLIEALRVHERKHGESSYYLKVRKQEPESPLEIAARFIYLNKTCFNGLYRVNSKGRFNVPKGRYKSPGICNPERLRTASKVLQKTTIRLGDFERVVVPQDGDFVYCDPPYDGCFTDYTAGGFTLEDQNRLRNAANQWVRDGATVLASNADTPLIRKLYKGKFNLQEATVPRSIAGTVSSRGGGGG